MKKPLPSWFQRTLKSAGLLLLLGSCLTLKAQSMAQLILTNYTFSTGKNDIGKVTVTGNATISSIRLKGPERRKFSITEDHHLSIRPSSNKPDVRWFDLKVQAQVDGKWIERTFRVVNDQFIRNKVIAHRGAWKGAQTSENSIAALKHAISLECQGSEFDIHMSADSTLFINHDADINNIVIERTPASQLSGIKLSNGENLPTLEEYLKAGLEQNRTRLILEIKPTSLGPERARFVASAVLKTVQKLKAEAWVDYISFDMEICRELIRLDPFARVAYLNGDKSPEELAAAGLWGLDYHYSVFKKNADWIDAARNHRLTLNAWTVNDAETMRWLLHHNFDFITTNEPELLLKLTKSER
jgi:glycerophosphoryl diester phosphodiesterase